jgi:hypothetical protein
MRSRRGTCRPAQCPAHRHCQLTKGLASWPHCRESSERTQRPPPGTRAEAEPCFTRPSPSPASAGQGSELRAALGPSRLWLQQKKREVRQLLAPIYGWFTEGFDTADLREARALLEQMELGDSTGSRHPR